MDGGYLLNGTKQFITNGMHSDIFIVMARTGVPGTKGLSLFLVPRYRLDAGQVLPVLGTSMALFLACASALGPGDEVLVAANERKAREAAAQRQEREREGRLAEKQAANLQNLFDNMGKDEQLTVNLLVRADVQGSVEAIDAALGKLRSHNIETAWSDAGPIPGDPDWSGGGSELFLVYCLS